jgi:hypothetical protein
MTPTAPKKEIAKGHKRTVSYPFPEDLGKLVEEGLNGKNKIKIPQPIELATKKTKPGHRRGKTYAGISTKKLVTHSRMNSMAAANVKKPSRHSR